MVRTDCFLPMLVGAVTYAIMNLLVRLCIRIPAHMDKKEQPDYVGQHISLIHSLQAIALCIVSYCYSNGIDYEGETDYLQVVTLAFSLGYFVYDAIYAEIFGIHDWPMRLHHICVVTGGIALLIQDRGGALGPVCLFLTELSNPFMQLRLILKGNNMENSKIYKANETTFAAVFILNRGGLGTIINYNVHLYDFPWLLKLMVSGVYGISLYWIYIIMSLLSRGLKNEKDLSGLKKCFLAFITRVRAHQILLCCAIVGLSVFLPITLKSLGCQPIQIVSDGFRIV